MFRLRCDVEGLHLELLTGRDVWTDAHGALAAYLLRGESGADEISEAAAARLLEQYPWPGMRRRVQSG